MDFRDRVFYPDDTERVKPLARKLVGNILLDQKEIWRPPSHMHASDAKWWIGFGAITAALIATDHSTSTLLENSKGQVTFGILGLHDSRPTDSTPSSVTEMTESP